MKVTAILAITCGLGLLFWGIAILTATRNPPEWENWEWDLRGREVQINRYALWWHTPDDGAGFWTTSIMFRWPRIQVQYMSKASGEWLRKDWDDKNVQREIDRLRAEDDKKYWVWPDWFGNMRSSH